MPEMTDTERRLVALIASFLDRDAEAIASENGVELGQLMPVRDLGADSLDMIELIMTAEEEFVIEISDEAGAPHLDGEGRPLGELVELIDRLLGEKAKAA